MATGGRSSPGLRTAARRPGRADTPAAAHPRPHPALGPGPAAPAGPLLGRPSARPLPARRPSARSSAAVLARPRRARPVQPAPRSAAWPVALRVRPAPRVARRSAPAPRGPSYAGAALLGRTKAGRTVTRATATERRPTPAILTTQEADLQPHVHRVPWRRAPRTASSSARGPSRSSRRSDQGWSTGDGRSEHVGSHGPPARTQGDRTRPQTSPTSGSRTSRHETSIRNPGPRSFPASAPPVQARAAVLPAHRASHQAADRRTAGSSTHPASAAARCAPWPTAALSWSFRPLADRPSGTTSSRPDLVTHPQAARPKSPHTGLDPLPGPRRSSGPAEALDRYLHHLRPPPGPSRRAVSVRAGRRDAAEIHPKGPRCIDHERC